MITIDPKLQHRIKNSEPLLKWLDNNKARLNHSPKSDTANSVNIYVGNHSSLLGIEDLIIIFSTILSERGIPCSISTELNKDQCNIIIEEFTALFPNMQIKDFREKHSDTKLILILTEFTTANPRFLKSFNNFSGIGSASVRAMADFYLRLKRPEFGGVTATSFLTALLFSPLAALNYLSRSARDVIKGIVKFRKLHHDTSWTHYFWRDIYMHMRYMAFQRHSHLFDGFILAHPSVKDNLTVAEDKILGVIHPEFDVENIYKNFLTERVLQFEVSGTITKYRKYAIEKLNVYIKIHGLARSGFHNTIVKPFRFENTNTGLGGSFSYHPAQDKHWKYSSPTRLYRSIATDYNIPMLDKPFGQMPIENLALDFSSPTFYSELFYLSVSPKNRATYISKKLVQYNLVVKKENDSWARRLF